MTSVRKIGILLVAVLVLFQFSAFGEEGILGSAIYAENSDDRITVVEYSEDETGYVDIKKTSIPKEAVVSDDQSSIVMGVSAATAFEEAEEFISRLYRVVLNRNPDEESLAVWATALVKGDLTAAEAVDGFFNSIEYINKNKTNEQVVTDCYSAMLDRKPDPEGMETWMSAMNVGMTYQAILKGFVGSQEFINMLSAYGLAPGDITVTNARDLNYERTAFVYRLYANCLGRTPDISGQESWCLALANGYTGTECANGFVFSSEFKDKHVSNDVFVQTMYRTILGREGDATEIAYWADLLNYTNTREHVFNGFLFSQEFIAKCAEINSPLGRKIATLDNTVAWQNNVEVLALCNELREDYGLDLLHTREDLWEDVAMVRADEITTTFSHDRPDGSRGFDVLDEAGMPKWTYAGENIAAGFATPLAVVTAWSNSAGHLQNILDDDFTDLATGYIYDSRGVYTDYWAQMFYAQ